MKSIHHIFRIEKKKIYITPFIVSLLFSFFKYFSNVHSPCHWTYRLSGVGWLGSRQGKREMLCKIKQLMKTFLDSKLMLSVILAKVTGNNGSDCNEYLWHVITGFILMFVWLFVFNKIQHMVKMVTVPFQVSTEVIKLMKAPEGFGTAYNVRQMTVNALEVKQMLCSPFHSQWWGPGRHRHRSWRWRGGAALYVSARHGPPATQ